uniref:Uncharacterized protein n=1 Tax=Anopheles albimanus TaxID=7167 RepID=A0A182FWL2_ANOAL
MQRIEPPVPLPAGMIVKV